MIILTIVALTVFGLCLGSFVNALVWRLHEQETESEKKKPNKQYLKDLSVSKGRSMCPDCHHQLAVKDLVPLFSWLTLGGKCRYCHQPISVQYPAVEVITAGLFILSYLYWPQTLNLAGMSGAVGAGLNLVGAAHIAAFAIWLVLLTGFMALTVYDIKWLILPNTVIYPMYGIAVVFAALNLIGNHPIGHVLLLQALAVLVGGGIFYVIFRISDKLIGFGDVRLGWILGLVAATPQKAVILIFLGSLAGSLVSVPLVAIKRLQAKSLIPFGPFLILGGVVVVLFGTSILHWYTHLFLPMQ